MKTFLIAISLMSLSFKTFSQVGTNDYKDYNPCTNCASTTQANNSIKQTGTNIKESTKREVLGTTKGYTNRVKTNLRRTAETVVITTLTIATSAVINKIK